MPITPAHLAQVASFEDLARLFYNELGWPRQEWPTFGGVAKLYGLSESDIPGVQSLAAVEKLGDDQTWGIFLVDFGANKMQRSALRGILNKIAERARQQHANPVWPHENILFIIQHSGNAFTLVQFRGETLANARLRQFGWTDPLEARTAVDNLNRLQWGQDWADAWNVEKLTKDFFTQLSDLFFKTADALVEPIPNDNERRLFVQTLFNRLIFLRFVEKKGWLRIPLSRSGGRGVRGEGLGSENPPGGEGSRPDYLRALWEAGQDAVNPFWPTRLNALFNAVNHETSDQVHQISEALIGKVPYLNGGLFDDDHRFANPNITIPEQVFADLLGPEGLFYRYNFTVEESSPLDVEVAVDPEILGKIFEQLTLSTKRHDTGSYYTPREIVQFMCREALVGYLSGSPLPDESRGEGSGGEGRGLPEAKARALVYEHNDDDLTNQEGTLAWEALKAIKVVDPACGSGAYLLGMLQELYALHGILYRRGHSFGTDQAKEEHERKLWIIENNIYGVDLQEFATNTAMLRLWLTLLVEDKGQKPQPLPNLEYKIETGDALLGPDPSQPINWQQDKKGQAVLYEQSIHGVVDELRKLREQYQNAHGTDKNRIKADLEAKLAELREKVTRNPNKDPAKFDWRVEFFDVFLEDPNQRLPGFDAVLANPPYVRHELITAIKPALKSVYGEFYCGTADLYTFFYARAHQLLRPGGMLAFISSNKWFRAAYGANLRRLMAEQTQVRSITDFGELPVFLTAATFPMIFVTQKGLPGTTAGTLFTQVKTLDPPYPDVAALIAESGFALPPGALNGAEWRLVDADTAGRMRRMEASGVPLGEYVKGKIYYGIKTGFNEAFVIDGAKRAELIALDPKSAEIIKPLAVGDDVRRWRISKKDKWLIFTRRGIDIDAFPAIKKHLSQWKDDLTPKVTGKESRGRKPGRYKWYEIQDDIAYYAEFDNPKIVYQEIATFQRFAYDTEGAFVNNKVFLLPGADRFLLAVLNSASAWSYLGLLCGTMIAGAYALQGVYMETLPIPHAFDADRAAIEGLVQQILDLKAADPAADVSDLEAEIDARVDFLYFHQHEAPTYDAWLAKREAEKGTMVEEVRKLIAAGESGTVEFKQSLEYVDPATLGNIPENQRPNVLAEKQKGVLHSALKTICAFLNSKGGTLLLGVHDNGTVIGIEPDFTLCGKRQDRDGFENKLTDLLKTRFRPIPTDLVIRFVEMDGKTVCRIDAAADAAPHYLDNKLHVRLGNSTEELTGRDLEDWLSRRGAK